MSRIPTVIVRDFKSYRSEDTPQEFIDALEVELARVADGEYDDDSMEVNADTPDDVLDAFLFGDPTNAEPSKP